MSAAIAVIGGTGMNQWPGLEIREERNFTTPCGLPSAPLIFGRYADVDVVFLPRHGAGHKLAPHMINYRANLWALRDAGVRDVIALAAVGAISPGLPPSHIAVPHDVIDYTYGRDPTFHDGIVLPLRHIELTPVYANRVREALIEGAAVAEVTVVTSGVMGVTQGPRLETAAEIRRMKQDGCDMVGMTGMPEAALARELGLDYAALALAVNWAAGLGQEEIHGEIERYISEGMIRARAVLRAALPRLATGAGAPGPRM